MKKKVISVTLITVLVIALSCLCACSSGGGSTSSSSSSTTTSASSSTEELRFVTAGEAGTYYAFGGVVAQHATNNAGISVKALTSGGSQANIESLQDGDAELAFCQSDVMTYAYEGTNLFTEAVDCFSVVGATFREQIQIVTLDPDINSVSDLKGKSVSIGQAGSGMYYNAIDVLAAYDMTEDDINATRQSNADAVDSLKNGQLDAVFLVSPAPTSAVVDLAASQSIRIIGLDDEHINKLLESSPFYAKDTIAAGTYTGFDEDVNTISVSAVIIAADSVDDDAVYALCKDLYDDPASLVDLHAKYAEIDTEFAASMTSVPYHPGAAKYFAEKGYTVTTK